MPVPVVSSRSNQPVTVNALIETPRVIAERIVKVLTNQFAMDQILRNEGEASGGAVQFRVSSGLFADQASEIVEEFGEIPVVPVSVGDLSSAPVRKRALAVLISREMRKRNNMGRVDNQIQRLKNTIVRDIDGVFVSTLRTAITQTVAATNAWSSGSATIRKNINAARRIVKTSTVAAQSFTGFVPDTLLISPVTEENLLNSAEFQALLFGSTGASNLAEVNDAERILKLKPVVSVGVADNEAFVVESKTIGGYADEFPLEATELYWKAENQAWRSDVSRSTVGFIDEPLAGVRITGI